MTVARTPRMYLSVCVFVFTAAVGTLEGRISALASSLQDATTQSHTLNQQLYVAPSCFVSISESCVCVWVFAACCVGVN